jgi:DNA-binding NarL/FixJ family response regulator
MSKIKLLIIDDQTLMREGLKSLLELEEDIEVVGTGKDGVEALELIPRLMPQVVLMDIRMPNMNGVECTKIIKENYSNIVVLALTTFNDEEYIVDILNYGASGYLLKDIEGEKLVQAIKDAINGNLIMHSEVAIKLAQIASKANKSLVQAKHKDIAKNFNFTEREVDVALMLSQGFTNKQIALGLHISDGTVKNLVSSIYSKTDIDSRAGLAIFLKEKFKG